ncbi:MAG: PAS domain-containing protein [Desulfobulbaceae bacterium]|nr:PAS domain-containing protein [Desulfobulbaceae bacterium]HIJ89638.1 PAS domain-containing protein [Deltaproteobacteria bacterium]
MTWKMHDRRGAKEDRRATGRMLLDHLRFLQSVINGVTDPVLVIGTDMRVKLINQAGRDFPVDRGKGRKCAGNAHCYRVLFGREHACDQGGCECPLMEVLETGKPVTVSRTITLKTGALRHYEVFASPLRGANNELLGIIEILRDVTERNLAAEVLRKSHDELERRVEERTLALKKANNSLRLEIDERRWAEDQLIQSLEQAELVYSVIPSAIFTVDLKRNITSWNKKAESVTGYTEEEVIGKTCSIFARHPCSEIGCGVYSEKVDKPIINRICHIKTKDDRIRVISKSADLLRDANGMVVGAVESFEDITVQQDMDRQLRTERDKFRGILAALDQGMHILNHDFIIEYQNEVLRRIFGDKIGEKCYRVYKQRDEPCEVCRMQAAIEQSEVQRTEEIMSNMRHYEQSYVPFTDVDGEAKCLILLRDVTEEKKYRAETMRAGQLASIGELAAGVAHEINNPINGIINYAQVLIDDSSQVSLEGEGANPIQREMLDRIIKEGERVAYIVRNLLFFARQRDEDAHLVEIETVINDALALIKHQFQKDGVLISVEIPTDLPEVKVNHQQLQQVFLNLLSNSRHALNHRYSGRDPGKKLEIRCSAVQIEGKAYVRTEITDHGEGIPPDIISHIFEPFFSSKNPGEGTGLGLSISLGLVKDFHGFLSASSEPGSFTTMTVDIPANEAG